jgi:rod shape-determining protein MreD
MSARAINERDGAPIGIYLTIPLLALVATLQSTVLSQIRLFGVSPDLVLLLAISWVLVVGRRDGLVVALIGGVMLDALSGAPFGLVTLSLLLVSALTALGERNIPRSVHLLPYLVILAATLVQKSVLLLLLQMSGRVVLWGPMMVRAVLPATMVNVLAMVIVYNGVRWVHARLEPQRMEWQ